ncbi:MAG: hypothetical protein DRR19_28015 [Candidatus Parabeggiatoa sp. nov. 1]|nr:MAG: hypothetical protein DRR19_28015 [Gammaproteobacteria bacterium]
MPPLRCGLARGIAPTISIVLVGAILYGCLCFPVVWKLPLSCTREGQYRDIQNAVLNSGLPYRIMESFLTLADINNCVGRFETQKTFLVFGGGRLIDFLKLVCAKKDCDLVVSPIFLSNDGFASGCSSLPSGVGSYVTLSSKIPLQVYGIYSI